MNTMPAPDGLQAEVDIVIVNWNTRAVTLDCLRSLQAELIRTATRAEVWLVDNASADGSADAIAVAFPEVHLIRNTENVGFARANNQGIRLGSAPLVLLLNSDTLIPDGHLRSLLDAAHQEPDAGVFGPRLIFPDGERQSSVDRITTPADQWRYLAAFHLLPFDRWLRPGFKRQREALSVPLQRCQVELVSAACVLVRRTVFDQIGLLPEQYFLFSEENDFFFRAREAAVRTLFVPEAEIIHLLGGSRKKQPGISKSELLFMRSRLAFLLDRYPRQRASLVWMHRLVLAWAWLWVRVTNGLRGRRSLDHQRYSELLNQANDAIRASRIGKVRRPTV